MASATNITNAQTPDPEACTIYAKRDNIAVGCLGTADATDPRLTGTTAATDIKARASEREIDRYDVSGGHTGASFVTLGQVFTPDAADYDVLEGDRSAP